MRIIVFGGSGFLGSHVSDALTDAGHEVLIYDLYPSPYLRDGQTMVLGDIRDPDRVREAVEGCDYAYNFAGIADLDDACTKPGETILLNVHANSLIMDAALAAGCKKYLYASTIYVYSDKGGFYRCSKQASELYVEQYRRYYGLPYTILRYGTLYGPRADRRNSIYRYLAAALRDGAIEVKANGDELREYIHVRDAARLSVEVLESRFDNSHVTITGNQALPFRDLLAVIKEMLGDRVAVNFLTPVPNGAHYSRTPYSFTPKVGHKLTSNYYVDMGQGLLECLAEIHEAQETAHAHPVSDHVELRH